MTSTVEQDVLDAALQLGMDPERDTDLLHIAKEFLDAPVPPGWEVCETDCDAEDDDGTSRTTTHVYYFHRMTGESSWEHPLLSEYVAKYEAIGAAAGDGAKAASRVSSGVILEGVRLKEGSITGFGTEDRDNNRDCHMRREGDTGGQPNLGYLTQGDVSAVTNGGVQVTIYSPNNTVKKNAVEVTTVVSKQEGYKNDSDKLETAFTVGDESSLESSFGSGNILTLMEGFGKSQERKIPVASASCIAITHSSPKGIGIESKMQSAVKVLTPNREDRMCEQSSAEFSNPRQEDPMVRTKTSKNDDGEYHEAFSAADGIRLATGKIYDNKSTVGEDDATRTTKAGVDGEELLANSLSTRAKEDSKDESVDTSFSKVEDGVTEIAAESYANRSFHSNLIRNFTSCLDGNNQNVEEEKCFCGAHSKLGRTKDDLKKACAELARTESMYNDLRVHFLEKERSLAASEVLISDLEEKLEQSREESKEIERRACHEQIVHERADMDLRRKISDHVASRGTVEHENEATAREYKSKLKLYEDRCFGAENDRQIALDQAARVHAQLEEERDVTSRTKNNLSEVVEELVLLRGESVKTKLPHGAGNDNISQVRVSALDNTSLCLEKIQQKYEEDVATLRRKKNQMLDETNTVVSNLHCSIQKVSSMQSMSL